MRKRNRAPQEKMPDEEFSRRILFYGHLANLCAYGCIAGAVLGVLAGILLESFAAGCVIVMLVIVAAVFLIQLIHAMQSALILGQLGDGFLDALRKAFGPQPEHKQWPMSNELVRRSGLFPEEWESASARGSYEGSYQGIPFAMHNASLTHVWEVRDPMPDDPHNTRTCSKTIFKGLFLVCRMRRPVAQEAFVLPGSPRPGFWPGVGKLGAAAAEGSGCPGTADELPGGSDVCRFCHRPADHGCFQGYRPEDH